MKAVFGKKKGTFLTFEGGEGSGKSTQAKRLAAWLEQRGFSVVFTREPGGTELGQKIRGLVLDRAHTGLDPRAELLLYEADRAQHVAQRILPALERGQIVICDRFTDSSLVYQGICRGLGIQEIKWLNRYATFGLNPELVILLDVPVKIAIERIKKRTANLSKSEKKLDRFERETRSFHENIRKGFLALARATPRKFCVINGSEAEDAIAEKIQALVVKKLEGKRLWEI